MTLSTEEWIKRVSLIEEVLVQRMTSGRVRVERQVLVRQVWHDLVERKLTDKPSQGIIDGTKILLEARESERLTQEAKEYFRALAWMLAELGIDRHASGVSSLSITCADAQRLLDGAFSRFAAAMAAWNQCVSGQTGSGNSGSQFDQRVVDSWFIDAGQASGTNFVGECAELRRTMDELGRELAIIGRVKRQACSRDRPA